VHSGKDDKCSVTSVGKLRSAKHRSRARECPRGVIAVRSRSDLVGRRVGRAAAVRGGRTRIGRRARARCGRRRRLRGGSATLTVVGQIKARSLELNGRSGDQLLERTSARGTDGVGLVVETLDDLHLLSALLALVFVQRHRLSPVDSRNWANVRNAEPRALIPRSVQLEDLTIFSEKNRVVDEGDTRHATIGPLVVPGLVCVSCLLNGVTPSRTR